MYEDLRKEAKKKVEAKMGFYITAISFVVVSIILFVVSYIVGEGAAFWLRFSILCMGLILGMLYLIIFGFPVSGILSDEWQEDEMEREVAKLYRKKLLDLPPDNKLSEADQLELKELERLKKKWDVGEEYV